MTRTLLISKNPATGETVAEVEAYTSLGVAACASLAREQAAPWAARPLSERLRSLTRLRELLARDARALAAAITHEIGKPLQESLGAEVLPSVRALRWLEVNAPRVLQSQGRGSRRRYPEPLGVIGVIGTWNYPLYLDLTPIAWAVAAGNAVLWKPSELAVHCSRLLNDLFQEAGLPVVMAPGDGETGRAVVDSDIDKLAFVGSASIGRSILQQLAQRNIPAVMELSGNDAFVVCEDAAVQQAAQSAVWGRVANAGQSCVAPQRFYVARAVYQEFLSHCEGLLRGLRLGNGMDEGVDVGPLRTPAIRNRADELVRDAIKQGACLVCGGNPADELPGCFYHPTLLAGCDDSMRVMNEDFFGPVLAVCPVEDEEEAIHRVNSHPMALGASVWTKDRRRGVRIAHSLNVGLVSINDVLRDAAEPGIAFGGVGSSGFGKMRGAAGLLEFVQQKTITTRSDRESRRHLYPYQPATIGILEATTRCVGLGGKERFQSARAWVAAVRKWKG